MMMELVLCDLLFRVRFIASQEEFYLSFCPSMKINSYIIIVAGRIKVFIYFTCRRYLSVTFQ